MQYHLHDGDSSGSFAQRINEEVRLLSCHLSCDDSGNNTEVTGDSTMVFLRRQLEKNTMESCSLNEFMPTPTHAGFTVLRTSSACPKFFWFKWWIQNSKKGRLYFWAKHCSEHQNQYLRFELKFVSDYPEPSSSYCKLPFKQTLQSELNFRKLTQ